MVADSNSDSVSVIDTTTNKVVNSFSTDPLQEPDREVVPTPS